MMEIQVVRNRAASSSSSTSLASSSTFSKISMIKKRKLAIASPSEFSMGPSLDGVTIRLNSCLTNFSLGTITPSIWDLFIFLIPSPSSFSVHIMEDPAVSHGSLIASLMPDDGCDAKISHNSLMEYWRKTYFLV